MDRTEALARLGLDENATRENIEGAYRSAIKTVHPDRNSTATSALASALNEARAVALRGVSQSGMALVPLDVVNAIVQSRELAASGNAKASERAMKTVVMHHVGAMALRRRQRAVLGAASAGVAALLGLIAAIIRAGPEEVLGARGLLIILASGFGVLAALLGLVVWRITTAERMLQLELDDVGETLSDRGAYSDALTELGISGLFTRGDLHRAIERWEVPDRPPTHSPMLFGSAYRSVPLAWTAARIGPVDFAKLMLTTGVELGLIQEAEDQGADGARVYGYRRI